MTDQDPSLGEVNALKIIDNIVLIGDSKGQLFQFSFSDSVLNKIGQTSTAINSIINLSDSKTLVGCVNGDVCIFEQGEEIFKHSLPASVNVLHVCTDGKTVLAGTHNSLHRLNLQTGESIHLIGTILESCVGIVECGHEKFQICFERSV